MRATRISIAAIILTSFFLLAVRESRYASPAFGQAVAPAPPVITLPNAPGQPQSFATIGALPQLAPAPGTQAVATPQATPQVFRCACNGPGFPTSWIGQVQAANFLQAEQSAPASCSSYLIGANAESPLINPPSSGFSTSGRPVTAPGTLYSGAPGAVQAGVVSPLVLSHEPVSTVRKGIISSECARCSCN